MSLARWAQDLHTLRMRTKNISERWKNMSCEFTDVEEDDEVDEESDDDESDDEEDSNDSEEVGDLDSTIGGAKETIFFEEV